MKRSRFAMRALTLSSAAVLGMTTVAAACPATENDSFVSTPSSVTLARPTMAIVEAQEFYQAKITWAGAAADHLAAAVARLDAATGSTATIKQHRRAEALLLMVTGLRAALSHIPTSGTFAATPAQQARVAALQARLTALANTLTQLTALPVAAPAVTKTEPISFKTDTDKSDDPDRDGRCDHDGTRFGSWDGYRDGARYRDRYRAGTRDGSYDRTSWHR